MRRRLGVRHLTKRFFTRMGSDFESSSHWPSIIWILAIFLCLCAIGLTLKPLGFERYFVQGDPVFDVGHYQTIARLGYDSMRAAFYPLWPLVVRGAMWLVGAPQSVLASSLLAGTFFFVSVYTLILAFRLAMSRQLAAVAVALYAFNPNSLFHVLSYPESVSALLAGLFLVFASRYLLTGEKVLLWAVGLVMGLFSLSRPILLQAWASGVGAIFLCRHVRGFSLLRELRLLIVILAGSAIGYSIYGTYCFFTLGSFFAPFAAQAHWGRTLSLNFSLLYRPNTVSSSDVVLLWDLQAFYGPFILALWLLHYLKKCPNKISAIPGYGRELIKYRDGSEKDIFSLIFLAWFSILFAASHGAIAFLSYPIFMSLGRHVFALPFVFYGFGFVLNLAMKSPVVNRWLGLYMLFSAAYLVCWWERYARGGWIG